MLNDKRLEDFTNLFSPNNFKIIDKITLEIFNNSELKNCPQLKK